MLKRRLFNPDENSPNVNSSVIAKVSPNRGGLHPALMGSKTPLSSAKKVVKTKTTKSTVNEASPKETNKNSHTVAKAQNLDSDSDSLDIPDFFSSSNLKLPYSRDEDELILEYVLKGQNIFKVSSISLWKQLEAKKENPKRTYQSLKNRFLRNIKPHLFSTYGHLIKDKTTTERILAKFPELKQKMGKKETLSRIKLPERKPPLRPAVEEDAVSSTSTNESQENLESADLQLALPSDIHPKLSQSKLICPTLEDSVLPRIVIHPRTIKTNQENITVCVNLQLKKYAVIPSMGIYEKFQRLSIKNKLVFCSACGRFNRPRKTPQSKSSTETDVFIPNSMDTPRTPTKSLKKINHNSECSSKRAKRGKTNSGSEPSCRSPCSPSLLKDVGETGELDKFMPRTERETRVAQVEVVSNSVTVRKGVSIAGTKVTQMSNCTENRSKIVRVTRGSSSGSRKEGNSRTEKRQRDSDEDLDSICEDAMTNFRKLIDHEEEQQLVKKCLNKNYKSIGLEAVSQTNWDSYFLDSSSELDTPPLTIDYETDSQNNETIQSESTGGSPLSKNIKKMLRGRNRKS